MLGGVDLFFVLSGFLIGGILVDNKSSPNFFRAFWSRRIARIFPVYFLLLFTYAIALYVNSRLNIAAFNVWLLAEPQPPWWSLVTFMQNYSIAAGGYGGPRWIGITWSVAIEEQFYMFFPIAVYFMTRRVLVAFAIAVVLLISPALRILVEWYYGSWYAAYVWPLCRMDGLMFGVLVALVVRTPWILAIATRWRYALDAALVFLIYGICSSWFHPPFPYNGLRFAAMSLMFSLVVLRIFLVHQYDIFRQVLRAPVLAWFGLISYALYMYHQAVNGLVHGLIFNQEPTIVTGEHWVASLGVMVISIGLAQLSYQYFETPIRRLGQRVRYETPIASEHYGKLTKETA